VDRRRLKALYWRLRIAIRLQLCRRAMPHTLCLAVSVYFSKLKARNRVTIETAMHAADEGFVSRFAVPH